MLTTLFIVSDTETFGNLDFIALRIFVNYDNEWIARTPFLYFFSLSSKKDKSEYPK
jgi:hypothetical protein